MSYPGEKTNAIKKLAELASEWPSLEDEILELACKIIGPARVTPVPMEPTASEMILARNGEKINAIKAHRNRTGVGLKESKDAIERAGYQLGFMDYEGRLLPAFQKAS